MCMTWREFLIRSEAFKLEEEQRIEEFQFLLWRTELAPHLKPDSIPTTFEAYKGRGKMNDAGARGLEFYNKEMQKYLEAQNNGTKITS